MQWNQQTADEMWMGFRDKDNLRIMRNPTPCRRRPGIFLLGEGPPRGLDDAFKNNIYSFYKYIEDGKRPGVDACDFATFREADRIIRLTEAIVKSSAGRQWVSIV